MSSSLDLPCWWHLIEALHAAERGTLAQEIAGDFSKLSYHYTSEMFVYSWSVLMFVAAPHVDIQKKLLDKPNHHLKARCKISPVVC